MPNKRKTTTAIVAGVAAAALLLGGTFAWTSISQQARNEAVVDINPGGRLHDDFNGTNKDVYVENFGDTLTGVDIFARVRLDQYFEVGQDAGKNKDAEARKADVKIGGDINDVKTWVPFKPVDDNGSYIDIGTEISANTNWNWQLGNDGNNMPIYLPTFNMNKDSLLADINGTYDGTVKDDVVHYDDYKVYEDNVEYTGTEIHDWDDDSDDEPTPKEREKATDPWDSADVYHENAKHTAKPISTTAEVITMEEWMALVNDDIEGNELGDFWVYDQDGWAYWANPIAPGETTGLLLDGIEKSKVPDDNWYYGINVVGQFATAGDIYEFEEMTEEATQLVDKLTGKVEEEEAEMQELALDYYYEASIKAKPGEKILLSINADDEKEYGEGDLSVVVVEGDNVDLVEGEDYTYDSDSHILVITNTEVSKVDIYTSNWTYGGSVIFSDTVISFDGSMDLPLAIPNGSVVELGVDYYLGDEDELTYYIISEDGNEDLEKTPLDPDTPWLGNWYLTELEEKDGYNVIAIDGSVAGTQFTQYLYGKQIVYPEYKVSIDTQENSVECVAFIVMDSDDNIVATAYTKVYNSENHTYLGSNLNSIDESTAQLIFGALDENGNMVGHCVANAKMDILLVSSMRPAAVTPGEDADSYAIGEISANDCDGNHSASQETFALYSGDFELTTVAPGQSYSLSIKNGEAVPQTVIAWAVSGNRSTGTTIDENGNLTVGNFELGDFYVLATLDGEYFANAFSVTVNGTTDLTDHSETYALAHRNGGSYEDEEGNFEGSFILNDYEIWPSFMSVENFLMNKNLFTPDSVGNYFYNVNNQSEWDDPARLKNIVSLELVGSDLNALKISGSWNIEDETINFGVIGNDCVSFRTAEYDIDEEHTLYIITEDGYVAYNFKIIFSEGE